MHYSTIIVGAGSMGMAAGYYLAKNGEHVLLIDAFDPPHSFGSHHGETRITRTAYGEGQAYVPMAIRARELWDELEQLSARKLFLKTGVLNMGIKAEPFIQNVLLSAENYHLDVEEMSATLVNERWPGIQLSDDYVACFEKDAGVLKVEECILAYRELAEKAGATILTNTRVIDIAIGERVSVKTDKDTYTGDHLIIAAGARINPLLQSIGLSLPIAPTRKTFGWFEASEALYGEGFPCFALENKDEIYYGFPSIDGAGYKLGRHDTGEIVDPDGEIRDFDENDTRDLQSFTTRFMPQVGSLKQGKTCFYSNTPDEDFILDQHPQYANIYIAGGFSGHGFKFASVIGELLSDLILEGESQFDLTPFRISRFQ